MLDSIIKERIDKIGQGIVPEGYKMTKIGILPNEWEIDNLGNCLDVRDGTHDSPQYTNSGIPFITSKNLVNGNIDWDNITYISREDHEKFSQRSYVEDGDILFGMIGTIGNPLIVKKDFEFSIKNVALLKFTDKDINNKYVLGILESDIIYKQFYRKSNAGVQKFIGLGMIRSLDIPTPPLYEQEKIADILSTWDEAIEKIEKLIKEKEIQKKGLMQQLLTGETRLQGFTDEWKEVKLGDITKNYSGRPLERYVVDKSQYRMVSIGNYSKDGRYIDNGQRIELNKETESKLLNKNDLVMVLNDKTKKGDIIGSTILIDQDKKYIYNQRSERIVIKKEALPIYLWNLLNSLLIKRVIYSLSQGGTQIYINYKAIKDIDLNLPSISEQKAIVEILSTADKEIELLNQLLENKKEEKKGLMQLLLTGIVRV